MRRIVAFVLLCSSSIYTYADTLLADPTKPSRLVAYAKSSNIEQPTYKVSWLRTGNKNNMAVVNGQRVQVGDSVDGATVLSIARSGVTLDVGNKKQLISLAEHKGFSKVKSGK